MSVNVVKQRLRLASVSPKLLDVYAEDGITLAQLMAFTVNGDHERRPGVMCGRWSPPKGLAIHNPKRDKSDDATHLR